MSYTVPLHVPTEKTEIAEEVWQYVTRILTNLSNTRAARIDNLDVFLSTRVPTTTFNAEMSLIKNQAGASGYNRITDSLQTLGEEEHHHTHVFPEDTDETVTFTAGNPANTWSAWAEIVDNNGAKLSDKITANSHITGLLIEDTSKKDDAYLVEIAYGDAKTLAACYRFIAGETTKLPAVQQIRIRAELIPPTEKLHFRYFEHS